MFHIALTCAHTIHADCGIKNPGNKMFTGDKRRGSLNSRALQSLSGCSPLACGGRDAAAAPAPPCGGSGNTAAPRRAGKMAPGSSRRLQGEHCKPLLACTYTHGTETSPALLAPANTRRLQLAPALRALPERSPLPLAVASLVQAAILPLPLATAITRSAASAAPRLAGPRLPPARGAPNPPPPPPPHQQRS